MKLSQKEETAPVQSVDIAPGDTADSSMYIEERVSENSSWKIYRNNDLGFEFEYPAAWELTTKDNYPYFVSVQDTHSNKAVQIFPVGEFDVGLPFVKEVRETTTLAGKQALKRSWKNNENGKELCWYEFPLAPHANWIAPNSEGKNGNRIQVPCVESENIRHILSSFTFI